MTARAMRLAALMLAATVLLGLALLSNHAFGWWLQARETLADLHLTWGLLGWVGILVVGVAYQVVPMFQLTPAYPARLTRWLAPLLFGLLLVLAPASHAPVLRLAAGDPAGGGLCRVCADHLAAAVEAAAQTARRDPGFLARRHAQPAGGDRCSGSRHSSSRPSATGKVTPCCWAC